MRICTSSLLLAVALVFAPGCMGTGEPAVEETPVDRGAAVADKEADADDPHAEGHGKGPCDCKHKDGEECSHKDGECPHMAGGDCPHKADGKGPCDCKHKEGEECQHAAGGDCPHKGDGKGPCDCKGKDFVDEDGDGVCDHHAKPAAAAQ